MTNITTVTPLDGVGLWSSNWRCEDREGNFYISRDGVTWEHVSQAEAEEFERQRRMGTAEPKEPAE